MAIDLKCTSTGSQPFLHGLHCNLLVHFFQNATFPGIQVHRVQGGLQPTGIEELTLVPSHLCGTSCIRRGLNGRNLRALPPGSRSLSLFRHPIRRRTCFQGPHRQFRHQPSHLFDPILTPSVRNACQINVRKVCCHHFRSRPGLQCHGITSGHHFIHSFVTFHPFIRDCKRCRIIFIGILNKVLLNGQRNFSGSGHCNRLANGLGNRHCSGRFSDHHCHFIHRFLLHHVRTDGFVGRFIDLSSVDPFVNFRITRSLKLRRLGVGRRRLDSDFKF